MKRTFFLVGLVAVSACASRQQKREELTPGGERVTPVLLPAVLSSKIPEIPGLGWEAVPLEPGQREPVRRFFIHNKAEHAAIIGIVTMPSPSVVTIAQLAKLELADAVMSGATVSNFVLKDEHSAQFDLKQWVNRKETWGRQHVSTSPPNQPRGCCIGSMVVTTIGWWDPAFDEEAKTVFQTVIDNYVITPL